MFLTKQNPASRLLKLLTMTLVLAPTLVLADSRLTLDALPETLVKTEQCVNIDDFFGWGWDGQQSCRPSNVRLFGAAYPLSVTSRDFGGSALAWNRADLANKTVRCDYFSRSFNTDTPLGYDLDRYDITFLTDDLIPASAPLEDLSDVTGHLYLRGWQIGSFGRLQSRLLVDLLNGGSFSTDKGYLIMDDLGTRNADNEFVVASFSHCYYRDLDEPLRASGYCVDFDGDGIGWNGTETCEVPAVDPNCDYSDASLGSNKGWGYNTATGQSCPPTGNPTTYTPRDQCLRSGAEGWGWNEARQETCRIDE